MWWKTPILLSQLNKQQGSFNLNPLKDIICKHDNKSISDVNNAALGRMRIFSWNYVPMTFICNDQSLPGDQDNQTIGSCIPFVQGETNRQSCSTCKSLSWPTTAVVGVIWTCCYKEKKQAHTAEGITDSHNIISMGALYKVTHNNIRSAMINILFVRRVPWKRSQSWKKRVKWQERKLAQERSILSIRRATQQLEDVRTSRIQESDDGKSQSKPRTKEQFNQSAIIPDAHYTYQWIQGSCWLVKTASKPKAITKAPVRSPFSFLYST